MKENGQKLASFKDAGVNLSDFALFLSVMKHAEAHESVLSIIMDEPDLKLARVHVLHIKMYSSPFRITVWKAVDAYWHPLTPEHGFPSLISYKAQGAPPRPAACWRIPFSPFKVWFCYCFFCHLFRKHNDPKFFKSDDIKTGDTHHGMSPVKIHIMTSYGGIIRIRLKGRSSITSSQPANELPCFL